MTSPYTALKRDYAKPEDYSEAVEDKDFYGSIPKDGAVFYSDDYQGDVSLNRLRAEDYAKGRTVQGKKTTTLEQTPGGEWLDKQKLFEPGSPVDDPDAAILWRKCSKQFAERVSGDARCFVAGASPRSVFRTTELPALLKNPNVDSLNGVSRAKLQAAYDQNPNKAFQMVADADTDLRAAATPPPPAPSIAGGGPLQVVNAQNTIICTGCPTPIPLTVTSNQTVFASKQLCATIADCIPMVNIMPFGPCLFTPAPPSPSGGPCVPKPTGLWRPGSTMTKHQKMPALRQTDTLQCASGGTITIAYPGQTQVFVT